MEQSDRESSTPDVRGNRRGEGAVRWGMALGFVAAIVGAIDGIYLAVQSRVVNCPDGTRFPEGTEDFRCFSHPQAAQGVAVVAVSVMLAVLIGLVSTIALAAARSSTPD
jgi:hypothetical protein